MLKLLTKELIFPTASNRFLFLIAPMISFGTALAGWAIVPFSKGIVLANLKRRSFIYLGGFFLGVYGMSSCRQDSDTNMLYLALCATKPSAPEFAVRLH